MTNYVEELEQLVQGLVRQRREFEHQLYCSQFPLHRLDQHRLHQKIRSVQEQIGEITRVLADWKMCQLPSPIVIRIDELGRPLLHTF